MSIIAVGQPLERVEGRLKVTGQARYSAEIPVPNITHAAVVRSSITRGRIVQMDTSAAESAPGVLAVITHKNARKLSPAEVALEYSGRQRMMGGAGQSLLPLQDESIYHNGQYIGIVVAETFEQATYAATLFKVRYEIEQPVVSMDDTLSHITTPENVWGAPPDINKGDIDQGLAGADISIDQVYTTARQHNNPMETHATIAIWEGDQLTLYEPSTWVYGVRNAVSSWFDMPEDHIRVIQHFVGGSFGCKGPTWPHVALTVMAAQYVGRPVKLVLSRQQEYTSAGYRPEIRHHIQLGATQDGHLTAVVHEAIEQTATFDARVVAPVTKTTHKIYSCPNIASTYRLAHGDLPGPFTMRGPGESPGLFAIESAMDELAYALNMDPIELRLRNYAETDPETALPWSSKSLRECYRQGAERFGWSQRNPRPCSMRDGDFLVGWGMSTMAYDAKAAPAAALARLFADNTVQIQSATCDQGTGSYTIMRQIAADALGLSVQQVRFELGDTHMPMAPISAGSMTTASVGSTVETVALCLRHKLLELASANPASPLYGRRVEDMDVEHGRCFLKEDQAIGQTYADILELYQQDMVEVSEEVKPGNESQKYTCYSFGAHFAEVYVRPETCETRVTRYVGAFGAGRIINPLTARSQLVGGIVWGIGMALMEHTIIDPASGRIVNADLVQYHVPVNTDIPDIDAFFVEEVDPHVNRLGVKGLGEIGTVGSAAAIANAVYHATGKRIRTLPITPDKLL